MNATTLSEAAQIALSARYAIESLSRQAYDQIRGIVTDGAAHWTAEPTEAQELARRLYVECEEALQPYKYGGGAYAEARREYGRRIEEGEDRRLLAARS